MRGVDKLMQDVDGQPLLAHVVGTAIATGHPVFAALPGPLHPRYALLRPLAVTALDIPDSSEGMGGTLRGAVRRLPPCQAFMVLLADIPDIETADLQAVFDARRGHPGHMIWRGATEEGMPGHPILFDASLRPQFSQLHGDSGGESLVQQLADQTYLVPLPGNRARHDLDTPEEWANWRAARGEL